MDNKRAIGLVLSGGGARGIAHVGVLKALNDNAIFPQEISGTSMGAIIGLMYAAGLSPEEIIKHIEDLKFYNLLTAFSKIRKRSLKVLYPIIKKSIGVTQFDELKLPLHIAVSNVNSGKAEMVNSGDCIHAALASASIPFVFRSYSNKSLNFIDGGLLNNFPIDPFLSSDYSIIGVDVNYIKYLENTNRMFPYVERSIRMALFQNVRIRERFCDVLLEPQKLGDFTSFDFKSARRFYDIGEEEALLKMDTIKTALASKMDNDKNRIYLKDILYSDQIENKREF
jgi:NTE family protein